MTYVAPNSVQARDIACSCIRRPTSRAHLEQGPMVIERGQGSTCGTIRRHAVPRCAPRACGARRSAMRRSGWRASRMSRCASSATTICIAAPRNEPGVDLAEKLLQIAPVPMSKVLFQCSGSEANDTAIKLVWYYHAAIGKPEKRKIIGRHMGYHGSTSASISASGKPDMHADFGLPFPDFRHTEYPHYYRRHHDGESEEQFATRMADALEATDRRGRPGHLSAASSPNR